MAISVRKNLVASSKYSVKCPYSMDAKYITFHNTANDASADAEIRYMIGNNNEVSYHFAVDDKEVVQGIPTDRNAWHTGDGNGASSGNRTSIGVEVCYSKSGGAKYRAAENLAIKFIAQLLKEHGWGIDRLRKHQDWSGKYCPHRVLAEGRWEAVKAAIAAELKALGGKSSVYLPASAASWRIYPTNKAPVKGNECGLLRPKKFGGLKYEVLGNPQTDVYTIKTDQFGKVNIYAAKSTGATVK